MPETELKISLEFTLYLQTHKCNENPAKRLKWSQKERLAKVIIAWIGTVFERYYNMFDRDLNTIKPFNMLGS